MNTCCRSADIQPRPDGRVRAARVLSHAIGADCACFMSRLLLSLLLLLIHEKYHLLFFSFFFFFFPPSRLLYSPFFFSLPPINSRNSDPGSHSSSLLRPSSLRFVPCVFIAGRFQLFLPSSTRVELCLPCLLYTSPSPRDS